MLIISEANISWPFRYHKPLPLKFFVRGPGGGAWSRLRDWGVCLTMSEISRVILQGNTFFLKFLSYFRNNVRRRLLSWNFPWGLHDIDNISREIKNKQTYPWNDLNDLILNVKWNEKEDIFNNKKCRKTFIFYTRVTSGWLIKKNLIWKTRLL